MSLIVMYTCSQYLLILIKIVKSNFGTISPRTNLTTNFPSISIAERKVTPPLYRALSLKYSRYFNFGIVHSSLAQTAMGLAKGVTIPRMDILISVATNNSTFNMAALAYEVEKYGPVQYRYLIRFLFSAHEKHWPELPGSDKFKEHLGYEEFYKEDLKKIFANPIKEKSKSGRKNPEIKEIDYANHKTICDDSTPGYCVVAFLDGRPEVFKDQLSVFSQVYNDKNLQGKLSVSSCLQRPKLVRK